MPIRLDPSESSTQDLFRHCIAPSISSAALFAGVARVFTSINPIGAAITGAVVPICDYVLDKILPDCSNCSEDNDHFDMFARFTITRLSSYALGVLAATTMGFPITFTKALLLSAGSNLLFLGTASIALFVATRFFAANAREEFMASSAQVIGVQCGNPGVALGTFVGTAVFSRFIDRSNASQSNDNEAPEQP